MVFDMPRGAPARKLAITVDRAVHAKVIKAAAEDRVSVSAWLTAAARNAIRIREGLEAMTEWEVEHGELSDDELAAAKARVARDTKKPARSRKRRGS